LPTRAETHPRCDQRWAGARVRECQTRDASRPRGVFPAIPTTTRTPERRRELRLDRG
jgi:hypothetical protein